MDNHTSKNCFKKNQKNYKNQKNQKNHKNQKSNKKVTFRESDSDSDSAMMVMSDHSEKDAESSEKDQSWYVDSCATSHMCKDKKFFITLEETSDQFIRVANNQRVPIKGQGTIIIKSMHGNTTLTDVLYVPDLGSNLLSVKKCVQKGFQLQMNKTKFTITKSGKTYLSGEWTKSNLPAINTNISETTIKNIQSHLQKCHFSQENGKIICENCIKGKMTRSRTKHINQINDSRNFQPGEFIHSDIMQMPELSAGGAKYVMVNICHVSKFAIIYPIKKKSDVHGCIVELINTLQNQHNRRLKIFRDDKGGEYISNETYKLFKSQGIEYQETHLDSPHENGKSERFNRTLLDAARAMLDESGLDNKFWAEAMLTATVLGS
jgi:hypothetical protein